MRWLISLAAVLWLLTGCAPREPWRQEAYIFGTRIELLIWGESEARAQSARAEVLREFDRLHRTYHAWQASELTSLNTAIAEGRSPLRIELLSPAGRPLAVTQSLETFWTNGYPGVRSDMRGRYPKHAWLEDPLNATPVKPRRLR